MLPNQDQPADPLTSDSKPPPTKRRNPRGGALSCAECRRLKLKCNRVFPCEQCIKRSCETICPTGTLTGSGKSNKLILSSTKELHNTIEELGIRIRELEQSLGEAHAKKSGGIHPLLMDQFLSIMAPMRPGQVEQPTEMEETDDDVGEELERAFGTLTISEDGGSNWYGDFASSQYLIQKEDQASSYRGDIASIPGDLLQLGGSFPHGTLAHPTVGLRPRLRELLPPAEEAWPLVESFFARAGGIFPAVPRAAFIRDTWVPIYQSPRHVPDQHLALMFMLLAIGEATDITKPPYSPMAEKYRQLGRAALALDCAFENPTIATVQAMYLLAYGLQYSDRPSAGDECFAMLGTTMKAAQGLALHRNPSKLGCSKEEAEFRSQVFWDILTYDMWQSMALGRPASMSVAQVDCPLPSYPEEREEGYADPRGFHAFKQEFTKNFLFPVMDQVSSAKKPITYSMILALDRNIRDNRHLPPQLEVGAQPEFGFDSSAELLTTKRYISVFLREYLITYIHRSYCSRAAAETRGDPLKHKYAPSVLASFKSATSMIKHLAEFYALQPEWVSRIYFLFSHAFSSAVTLATLVIFGPSWTQAPDCLYWLDQACDVFKQATSSHRVKKVLPTMLKLQANAHAAYKVFLEGTTASESLSEYARGLSVLGGDTRLVKTASTPSHSTPSPTQSPSGQLLFPQATTGVASASIPVSHQRAAHQEPQPVAAGPSHIPQTQRHLPYGHNHYAQNPQPPQQSLEGIAQHSPTYPGAFEEAHPYLVGVLEEFGRAASPPYPQEQQQQFSSFSQVYEQERQGTVYYPGTTDPSSYANTQQPHYSYHYAYSQSQPQMPIPQRQAYTPQYHQQPQAQHQQYSYRYQGEESQPQTPHTPHTPDQWGSLPSSPDYVLAMGMAQQPFVPQVPQRHPVDVIAEGFTTPGPSMAPQHQPQQPLYPANLPADHFEGAPPVHDIGESWQFYYGRLGVQ